MIQVEWSWSFGPSLSIQLLCSPWECCPCLHDQPDHGYRRTPDLRKVSAHLGVRLGPWANEVHTWLPFLLCWWWLRLLVAQPQGKLVMSSCVQCAAHILSLMGRRTDFGGQPVFSANFETVILPGLDGQWWERRPVVIAAWSLQSAGAANR